MLINTANFKEKCKLFSDAINISELSTMVDVVEIKNSNNNLHLNITNKNYYLSLDLGNSNEKDFRAVVNATTFLKLISQLTTPDIEINIKDNYLELKANGSYKLPLVYDDDKLIDLPEIKINNETLSMSIETSILEGIYKHNTKEIAKAKHINAKPINELYYMDEKGCITFTNSACILDFTLEKPIKLLLNYKLVNLFKVFFPYNSLTLKLGLNDKAQTILYLEADDIKLWGILNNELNYIESFPSTFFRNSVNKDYPYQITLNKEDLLQAIGRLSLLNNINYSLFELKNGFFTIMDINKNNQEVLNVLNEDLLPHYEYSFILENSNLKNILMGNEKYLTLKFGDHKGILIVRNNIKNLIPESVIKGDIYE